MMGIMSGLEPGTRLCLHSSFTNLFSPAGSLCFLPQSNRSFQGDLKGTLPHSDTCRQANIPVNTFRAPALASTPLERDARSSLALNNHSALSCLSGEPKASHIQQGHQPGHPGGVTHPVAVTGSLQLHVGATGVSDLTESPSWVTPSGTLWLCHSWEPGSEE